VTTKNERDRQGERRERKAQHTLAINDGKNGDRMNVTRLDFCVIVLRRPVAAGLVRSSSASPWVETCQRGKEHMTTIERDLRRRDQRTRAGRKRKRERETEREREET
jgi:hypothetical protein